MLSAAEMPEPPATSMTLEKAANSMLPVPPYGPSSSTRHSRQPSPRPQSAWTDDARP